MLEHIEPEAYRRFKATACRIAMYRANPVPTLTEVVHLAYLDANRTLESIETDQATEFKKRVVEAIEQFLAGPPDTQGTFDMFHKDCCDDCVDVEGAATIHYGQAQKLLNMALKYLYNEWALYQGENGALAFPDGLESFFHLPVDSQLRAALVRHYGLVDACGSPWSQWSYDNYIGFQHNLRRRLQLGYAPLEVDYLIWNAAATAALAAFRMES